MATQAKTNKNQSGVVEVVRNAGRSYLDAAEQAVDRVAELQERVAEASPFGWASSLTRFQAGLSRDVAGAYASAGRKLIG
jgi:hypothetical protein